MGARLGSAWGGQRKAHEAPGDSSYGRQPSYSEHPTLVGHTRYVVVLPVGLPTAMESAYIERELTQLDASSEGSGSLASGDRDPTATVRRTHSRNTTADPSDVQIETNDTPAMTDPIGRDVLDAHLKTVDARLETVEARLDGKLAQVGADVKVVGAKMDALVMQMSEFRDDVRSEVRGTKWWIVGSALSVAAIVVGVGAYVLTAAGNNMTSLQTGVAIGQALQPPSQ